MPGLWSYSLTQLGTEPTTHCTTEATLRDETFFMKSLSGTMLSSSGAGLATDTRKTLMPDSRASVAACSRLSEGQPSISTTITLGWPRRAPFSWLKKVLVACAMALPGRVGAPQRSKNSSFSAVVLIKSTVDFNWICLSCFVQIRSRCFHFVLAEI